MIAAPKGALEGSPIERYKCAITALVILMLPSVSTFGRSRESISTPFSQVRDPCARVTTRLTLHRDAKRRESYTWRQTVCFIPPLRAYWRRNEIKETIAIKFLARRAQRNNIPERETQQRDAVSNDEKSQTTLSRT